VKCVNSSLESLVLLAGRTDTAAGKCGVKDQVSTRSPNEKAFETGRVRQDMSVFSKILKAGEGKRVRQLAELVPPIGALADEMAALSDEELRAKTVEFRERLARVRNSTICSSRPSRSYEKAPRASSDSATTTSS